MDVLAQPGGAVPTDTRYYVVVYQFGKVASTSIVATLDELPGVTAVQSHFLGEQALASIIPTITGADVSKYFFQHQLGQFIHNTRITRHINRIRAGHAREELVVISLARDPMTWARSSIVQDMKGYLEPLAAYARRHGIAAASEGQTVTAALRHVMGASADCIAALGGIDAAIGKLQRGTAGALAGTPFEDDPGARRLFLMMLRPFDWFDKHFRTALGIGLEQMERTGLGLEYREGTARFLILRYEDLATVLPAYARQMNLADTLTLKRENTREEKLMVAEVAAAFASQEAERFALFGRRSAYCRTFGYDTAPTPAEAVAAAS